MHITIKHGQVQVYSTHLLIAASQASEPSLDTSSPSTSFTFSYARFTSWKMKTNHHNCATLTLINTFLILTFPLFVYIVNIHTSTCYNDCSHTSMALASATSSTRGLTTLTSASSCPGVPAWVGLVVVVGLSTRTITCLNCSCWRRNL